MQALMRVVDETTTGAAFALFIESHSFLTPTLVISFKSRQSPVVRKPARQ